MNWLQIRLFGPYFSSFSTNSNGYYSQMSQNLFSKCQIFASALIVRQAARRRYFCLLLLPDKSMASGGTRAAGSDFRFAKDNKAQQINTLLRFGVS
jgi:hypothetical protein